jgi:NADH:ubiquinone oxidoreductase subunit 2 (subunit N)
MIKLELFQMYHLKEMSLSAELFLSCSILQLTFYAVGTAYQRKHGFVILSQQIYHIGALIVGLAALLLINEDLLVNNSLSSNNFIINDYLSFTTKLVICLTSVLFLLIIKISYKDELIQNNFEYVILVTISILGLLLLCSSNDLITAYLSIELQSVAFYLMSAFKKNSSYSIESGLKYFIIGSLSSAFFLFGSSLIYGCVGSLSFDDFKIFLPLLAISNFSPNVEEETALSIRMASFEFDFKVFKLRESCYTNFKEIFTKSINTDETLYDWVVQKNPNPQLLSFVLPYTESETSGSFFNKVLNSPYNESGLEKPDFDLVLSLSNYFYQSGIHVCEAFTVYETPRVHLSRFVYPEYPIWDVSNSLSFLDTNENAVVFREIFKAFDLASFDGLVAVNSTQVNLDLVSIGFMLICVSLFIKLAIAPFHYWSLDVYEGSPNATTFFFAVVPKMGLFVLLLRICYVSFYDIFSSSYQFYFLFFAVLSIFVGSIGGLEQRKLKSLLAYSSISHTGYLLLSFSTGTSEGMQMMLYYLVIFMVAGLCFWAVFLFVRQKQGFYFNKHNKELGDLVLLKESNPMIALILAITLFSIAGIPPIVGFLAKIGIFLVVIRSSAYLISLISILFSVASTFYYLRLIKVLYFENILVGKLYFPISTKKSLLIAILSLLLIILCMDPMIIYLLFHKATLLSTQ